MALLLAAMSVTPATAQVQFGVKGGLNLTNMKFSKSAFDTKNQAGFFIGPTVKFTLPIVGLGIDASALYDYRSAKIDDIYTVEGKVEKTLKQHQIVIPINLRYTVGLGDAANVFFFAGPQVGFNIGDKDQTIVKDALEWLPERIEFQCQCRYWCYSALSSAGDRQLQHCLRQDG